MSPETIQKHHIVILGAGPGGLSAAMFLAKRGIKTLVLEKDTFPRDKICGDALSGKTVEVLNKLDPEILKRFAAKSQIQVGSFGVKFVAPNLKELDVPFKMDYLKERDAAPGFVAKRLDFDNFLFEEAKTYSDIELRENFYANSFEKREDGYLVESKSGEKLWAEVILAADGANSRFLSFLGRSEIRPKYHCAGLRAYYSGVEDLNSDNFIELHFVKNFLPGYFWIFPLPNGKANVGVGMRSDFVSKKRLNLKTEMLKLIENSPNLNARFKNAKMEGGIKGFGLPLGSKLQSLSGTRFMLIGDAGSLIDPFTGEGIGNAMLSGMLAAEVLEKASATNDYSQEFLAQYDKILRRRVGDELKLSYRMQRLVKYPWLFNLVVNKAQKNRTLRETITCMFEDLDMRERLRSPKFYFKLLFSNK